MDYVEAVTKLKTLHQEALLRFWDRLNRDQKQHLLSQIERLDGNLFKEQQALVKAGIAPGMQSFDPFQDYTYQGNAEDIALGEALLAAGQVGCLIVAGGQATRLKTSGPKGIYPVSVVRQKSLFQLFAEKTLAASRRYGHPLPLAIMTSAQNHVDTIQFFKEAQNFGLAEDQLSFFTQSDLPLLDEKDNLFLEEIDTLAKGPDGNGSTLTNFTRAGLYDKWRAAGVQFLNFILVDNPLADPFDANLVGYHARQESDITIKCIPRRDPHEKVGVVVKQGKTTHVVEYTEMPASEREARTSQGDLKHLCANISLFCFRMKAIPSWVKQDQMPLHLAHKAVAYVNEQGQTQKATTPMAWKFERFIFDLLPLSHKVSALLYSRELCFAPLKNSTGPDDIHAVREALQTRDRQILTKITGLPAPSEPFELAQEFYYPSPELLAKWKGRPIPRQTYLEP